MSEKVPSVHHSRTLMVKELSDVMAQGQSPGSLEEVLENNATGKRTKSNQEKTNRYLKQLYSFDLQSPAFKSFDYFWSKADLRERPLLALLFALRNDMLLSESIDLIQRTSIGNRTKVDDFQDVIEDKYPGKYSANTRKSMARNLASSWKQSGYLLGRIKNVRVETRPSHLIVAFAMLMAYLNGDRGQFIMGSKWVRALCLPQARVRKLAFEAAKRDLLRFQSSGPVTTVSFEALFQRIGINEIEN